MVDVGYCIDGKRGVIRNVKFNRMDRGFDAVWCEGKQEELYRLKFENIEYIIPSDIDNVSGKIVFDKDGVTEYGADGSVVMKGRYVENKNLLPPTPMTFAEKFKEVFGFEPSRCNKICDVMNCNYFHDKCQGCPYEDNDWDKPYVKAEVED